jgi:SAM-dependent methyltransferase
MIASEHELAGLCGALIGKNVRLLAAERCLVPRPMNLSAQKLQRIRAQIRAGEDPLGELFSSLRSPKARRSQGATYTPRTIVDAMIAWAALESPPSQRVVDPGCGSGRFLIAAAKAFPKAELIAIDTDPLATLMTRANAAVLGFSKRLAIEACDYRALALPAIDGPTLFIGNPPYVRHHDISSKWKAWFGDATRRLGFTASALAGLHVHFFVKTRQLVRPGDYGAFITAAEWLDVNYGSVLRKMLADGLGGTALHVIDPKALPFAGTFSTGAITCFRVGRRPDHLTIRSVDSLAKLAPLSAGRGVEWSHLEASSRWSMLVRHGPRATAGQIELGELFRVHRGQVTGCNAAWIAGDEASRLPARFLFPTVTRARELIAAGDVLDRPTRLRKLVDLPVDLDELTAREREAVDEFLAWARRMKADKSYVATHRRAWWSVGLRTPAPILCTYMARRAPAFVRNHAAARHLNIAHGLYPLQPLSDATLDAIARHLRETVCMSSGRVYAGGLVKFEPGEVSRLHIPEPFALHASA